jgi:Dolichyl-phosphate-mannose-protein mannosyltransferase
MTGRVAANRGAVRIPPAGWVLAGLVLLALGLRMWGVSFGLPHVLHPDENFEVYRALAMGAGHFDFDRISKSGYFYILFVEYGFLYVYLFLTHAVASPDAFARLIVSDPTPLWLVGRGSTAVIGAVNVVLVYRIGRHLQGPATGLLAAAFLAVAAVHVTFSHYITVDIPMTCLGTAALLYAVRIQRRGRTADYLLAGLFLGLAAMFKLPGVIVAVPIFVAHWMRMAGTGGRLVDLRALRPLAMCGVMAVVIYVAGNPGILWRGAGLIRGILAIVAGSASRPGVTPELERSAQLNLWLYYARVLWDGMGGPVLLAGVAGIAWAALRRNRGAQLLAVHVVAYYVFMSVVQDRYLVYGRYMLPIVPSLAILAGVLVHAVGARLWTGARMRTVALAGVAALMCLPALAGAVAFDQKRARPDTRILAQAWVEANVPDGTTVLVEGNPEEPSQLTVQLADRRENLLALAEAVRAENPGKAQFLELLAAADKRPAYDLVAVRRGERFEALSDYLEAGVDLFILSGPVDRGTPDPGPILRSRIALEDALRARHDFPLAATFDPDRTDSFGPLLLVFRGPR